MPNFLAFASVTATLSYILEQVNREVAGIKITTKPLDAIDTQNPVNGLNIFMYQAVPTGSIDAVDTLVSDSQGSPTNSPVLSLDLHYVISATSSDNDDIIAQKILASAMRILNNFPILSKEVIRKATAGKEGFEGSDLTEQVDEVKLRLDAMAMDDIIKVWARFPNANYRASISYVAQVIMLESKLVEPPGVMGAVSLGNIGQLKSPQIDRIEPQMLEYAPDVQVIVIGNGLKAPSVAIEFDDTLSSSVADVSASDTRVIAPLPKDIGPGIVKVRINHLLRPMQEDTNKKSTLKSNAAPFVLAPRIMSPRQGKILRGKELVIDFEPPTFKGKPVFVYLGDQAFPAAPTRSNAFGEERISSVKMIVPKEIPEGIYLVRISVNGATSLLVKDDNPHSPTFRKAISPYVELA